jgi:hypothetical protein
LISNLGAIVPTDTETTIPVLIHVNPDDWAEFKRISGNRRASMKMRRLIRNELKRAKRAAATRNIPCI